MQPQLHGHRMRTRPCPPVFGAFLRRTSDDRYCSSPPSPETFLAIYFTHAFHLLSHTAAAVSNWGRGPVAAAFYQLSLRSSFTSLCVFLPLARVPADTRTLSPDLGASLDEASASL